jgi:hypothetical protein
LTAARNFVEGDIQKGFVNLGWAADAQQTPNGTTYGVVAPGILSGTGEAGANVPTFKGFNKNQFQFDFNTPTKSLQELTDMYLKAVDGALSPKVTKYKYRDWRKLSDE